MKKQTIGKMFAEMRAEKKMTMLQIAVKCGLSETVVWHLEHDWPVRWETVHLILTVAFHIHHGSEKYQAMNLLWLKHRQEKAESQPENHGKNGLTKHVTEATRKFRNLVRDLDPASAKKVLAAATRAAKAL
jgi:hypothetical protein